MTEWIWERTADNSSRFVLGTVGADPLVCFGINPSTAVPNKLDPTVTRVSNFAARHDFDSWVMCNVYPQISTDPTGIHRTVDPELTAANMQHIAQLVADRPLTVLAAWGVLIDSRPYFLDAVRDLVMLPELAKCRWVSLGPPTKAGHPRHPLYLKATTQLVPFDIHRYVAR